MTTGPGGHVAVVGLGPGAATTCTDEVRQILARATDWVGYAPYLDMAVAVVPPRDGQVRHASDNREEADRARAALDLAATGRHVAVVSSGDPGVFAMAAAVVEQLERPDAGARWAGVELSVHAGVSAAQAAAARAGAPLGHDFCVISLSVNLKPWAVVERRLDAAAGADFVIALYNPRSRSRPDDFGRAVAVLARHRDGTTPVVLGRDVGRPGEEVRTTTLAALADPGAQARVDMRTVVIVGSSQTRTVVAPDGRGWTYTPRTSGTAPAAPP